MKYVEKYYPEMRAIGNISQIWGIQSFNLAKIDFNDKYYFVYQFASRKNLDQSLITPADSLSNFNQKIANKYKAGLSLNYLDNFLGNQIVNSSIKEFMLLNQYSSSNTRQFETILEKNAPKNIDWFFKTMIESRDLIDFKFGKVTKTKDAISFTIINKTNTNELIAKLKDIITEYDIKGIIIGNPINMDGSLGPRAQSARDFSKSLTEQLSIPVTLWDERLSSEGAYKGMSELAINVTKKQKKLDENSAAFILQGFIDYYKNQTK